MPDQVRERARELPRGRAVEADVPGERRALADRHAARERVQQARLACEGSANGDDDLSCLITVIYVLRKKTVLYVLRNSFLKNVRKNVSGLGQEGSHHGRSIQIGQK